MSDYVKISLYDPEEAWFVNGRGFGKGIGNNFTSSSFTEGKFNELPECIKNLFPYYISPDEVQVKLDEWIEGVITGDRQTYPEISLEQVECYIIDHCLPMSELDEIKVKLAKIKILLS